MVPNSSTSRVLAPSLALKYIGRQADALLSRT